MRFMSAHERWSPGPTLSAHSAAGPHAFVTDDFRCMNLVDAQAKGIAVVWERDLTPLMEFLAAAS